MTPAMRNAMIPTIATATPVNVLAASVDLPFELAQAYA